MLAVAYFTDSDTFPGVPVAGIGWDRPVMGMPNDEPTQPSDSIRSMAFYLGADAEMEREDAMEMVFTRPPQSPLYFWS